MNQAFRRGVRLGLPISLVSLLMSTSFGVLAVDNGMSVLQAVVMSAVVHAGSAQFAAMSVFSGGGGILPSVLAGGLMNSRFLAMGIAVAPSFPGRPLSRALQGQAVVDPSFALAGNGDGTFDRWQLIGSTVPQYVGWVGGTLVGALAGDVVGDLERWGLDAVFPAFFFGLLVHEVHDRRALVVGLLGAVIALALVPVAPPGLPLLAAAAAALVGLRR